MGRCGSAPPHQLLQKYYTVQERRVNAACAPLRPPYTPLGPSSTRSRRFVSKIQQSLWCCRVAISSREPAVCRARNSSVTPVEGRDLVEQVRRKHDDLALLEAQVDPPQREGRMKALVRRVPVRTG